MNVDYFIGFTVLCLITVIVVYVFLLPKPEIEKCQYVGTCPYGDNCLKENEENCEVLEKKEIE
jgi:hypothetical protein